MATPALDLTPQIELALVGRLALSVVLGGVLGWERQLGQQPAGLRTHMLVSMGSTAYTLAGVYGVAGNGTVQDAGRVAAQIVTGIGFIGAGAIWRSTGNERVIRGLTTAATIWMAASIGMLCGYGLYVLAIGAAALTVVVLRVLLGLERIPGAAWSRVRGLAAGRTAPAQQPGRAGSIGGMVDGTEVPRSVPLEGEEAEDGDGHVEDGGDAAEAEEGAEVLSAEEEYAVALEGAHERPHKLRGKRRRKKPKGKRSKTKAPLGDQIQD